jgi:hypothetical protein
MTTTVTLADAQKRAAALSETRDLLAQLFLTLQNNLDTVKTGSLAEIKRVSRIVARQHNDLQDFIKAHPELFTEPRTYVVDGVKFGLQASRGSLNWDDDAKLCTRIRRLVERGELTEEQAELLIVSTEKPSAQALARLDSKLLKALGVEREGAGDQVLIKSVDSGVEKAVNAVIKDAIKDASLTAEAD